MRARRLRLLILATVMTSLVLVAATSAFQSSVTRRFVNTGPLTTGLTEVSFDASSVGRNTVAITPEFVTGWPGTSAPQDGSIFVDLQLACDPGTTSPMFAFFQRQGRFGQSDIPVHHNRLVYRAVAYNGIVHEGHIVFTAHFTKKGTVATGTVRVWGATLQDAEAGTLTNCDTDPGGNPKNRGKPYKWRLVGGIGG
jgi:hypothetical protein